MTRIRLTCITLTWVQGSIDDPDDHCAHGTVKFEVDGVSFVTPDDGEWTVSAAALYLLRSLEEDHTPASWITGGNLLFPCCGFAPIVDSNGHRVDFMGTCPNGRQVWIERTESGHRLHGDRGEATVSREQWRAAVLEFADQVDAHYRACDPKNQPRDASEVAGWAAFWTEWRERRSRA